MALCAHPGGCALPRTAGRFVCSTHLEAAEERLEAETNEQKVEGSLRRELNEASLEIVSPR